MASKKSAQAFYVATGNRPINLEFGSDLWIALEQLQHGPLSADDVADLLDVDRTTAVRRIMGWQRSLYVCREGGAQGSNDHQNELDKVIELARNVEYFTPAQAHVAAGIRRTAIYDLLAKWVREGVFVNVSHGRYALTPEMI